MLPSASHHFTQAGGAIRAMGRYELVKYVSVPTPKTGNEAIIGVAWDRDGVEAHINLQT